MIVVRKFVTLGRRARCIDLIQDSFASSVSDLVFRVAFSGAFLARGKPCSPSLWLFSLVALLRPTRYRVTVDVTQQGASRESGNIRQIATLHAVVESAV